MKILKTIAVLILVVGLPAGSWLFLQSGLDWRRIKAKQLTPKSELLNDIEWSEQEQNLVRTTFDGITTFIINGNIGEAEKVIIDQFKDAYTFSAKTKEELPVEILQKLDMSQLKYMLIDTGMVVRQIYKDSQLETINRLIEDLALITPQPKAKDIKLRGRENE